MLKNIGPKYIIYSKYIFIYTLILHPPPLQRVVLAEIHECSASPDLGATIMKIEIEIYGVIIVHTLAS